MDITSELTTVQNSLLNIELLKKINEIPSHRTNYLNEIRKLSQSSTDRDPDKIVERGYTMLRYYRLVHNKKIKRNFD